MVAIATTTAYSTLYTDAGSTESRTCFGVQWRQTPSGEEGLLHSTDKRTGSNDGPGAHGLFRCLVLWWGVMYGGPNAATSWSWRRWLKHPVWNHSGSRIMSFFQ